LVEHFGVGTFEKGLTTRARDAFVKASDTGGEHQNYRLASPMANPSGGRGVTGMHRTGEIWSDGIGPKGIGLYGTLFQNFC